MKKNDFKNGDVVVQRDGELGFYFESENVFIYQGGGYDDMEMSFDDDLTCTYDEDGDIMKVYRADGGVISFSDYEEGDLIFERDETWKNPKAESVAATLSAVKAESRVQSPESIKIISQAFYGNRTCTEIKISEMDSFILGCLDHTRVITEGIDRTIIRISDNIVIVYNRHREESARKNGYRPLAVIPEMNLEIYSRCIACRMNENGEFESLKGEDYEIVMKYLAE